MREFFSDAPFGAIALVVLGTIIYIATAPLQAWNNTRKSQMEARGEELSERDKDALRQGGHLKFIGMGMILAGFAWWILEN